MVKIPFPNRDVNPHSVASPRMSMDDADSSGVQRAMDKVQNAAVRYAHQETERLEKEKALSDATWVTNSVTDMYSNWTQHLQRKQTELGDTDPTGFADGVVSEFKGWQEKALENAPSPEAKLRLLERSNYFGTHLEGQARNFETETRVTRFQGSFDESTNKLANMVITNPDNYELARGELLGMIGNVRVREDGKGGSTGYLPSDAAVKLAKSGESVLAEARVRGIISRDPHKAVQELSAGSLDSRLFANQKEILLNTAKVEINRREAEARARQHEWEANMRGQVEGALKVMDYGLVPNNLPALMKSVKGTKFEPVLQAAQAQSTMLSEFVLKGAGRASGQQYINEMALEVRKNPTPTGVQFLDTLKRVHNNASEQISKDAYSFAIQAGIIKEAPAINWQDKDAAAAGLQARAGLASRLEGTFGPRVNVPFSDEEITQIADHYGAQDATGKIGLLSTLQKNLGDRTIKGLAAKISEKDRIFGIAASTAAEPLGMDVARSMVKGQDIMKQNGDLRPEPSMIQQEVSRVIGSVVKDFPEVQAQITEAAIAVAVERAAKSGMLTKDAVARELGTSLKLVAGGTMQGTKVVGGPLTGWNGSAILPPVRGMSNAEFSSEIVRNMTDETMQKFGNGKPMFGTSGRAFTAKDVSDARFIQSGDGIYRLFMPGQGYIFTEQGETYRFNARALYDARRSPKVE